MFQMSGIQSLWVRVFVQIWDLNKNPVTFAFLVVSGLGGGIGLALGPRYIDRGGGFGTPFGVVKTLKFIGNVSIVAALAGAWGAACLWGIWAAVFLIWATRNACIPALFGIYVEVVPVQ